MADKKAKAAAAAAAPTSCCGGGGEKAKATGNVADTPVPKRQRVPRNLIMGQGGQRGQEGMYTPAVLAEINDIITHALDEDVGTGDVTSLSTIGADVHGSARFLAKADGVVAGLRVADMVCAAVDPHLSCSWGATVDGAAVKYGDYFGEMKGPARSLLQAERLTLNLMQRMSGIATATAAMVAAAASAATPAPKTQILDTRKTVPGLRVIDKIAHRIGGGTSHRWGLYDMVMVKDNHITAAGGLEAAVDNVRAFLVAEKSVGGDAVEVDASTIDQVKAVIQILDADASHATRGGDKAVWRIQRLMLDNMVKVDAETGAIDVSMVTEALELIAGRVETEVSGNVMLRTVPAIATTNVDFISSGALTHSVTALDISLKITKME
jgi:nicotinate-nucleotide pyrophosphorylase (carboxylating)